MRPADIRPLAWETDVRAKREGRDLRSVASRLTDRELNYWVRWLLERGTMPYEHRILQAEADRRGISTRRRDAVGQRILF